MQVPHCSYGYTMNVTNRGRAVKSLFLSFYVGQLLALQIDNVSFLAIR